MVLKTLLFSELPLKIDPDTSSLILNTFNVVYNIVHYLNRFDLSWLQHSFETEGVRGTWLSEKAGCIQIFRIINPIGLYEPQVLKHLKVSNLTSWKLCRKCTEAEKFETVSDESLDQHLE